MKKTSDNLLTLTEVSNYFGLSESTIRRRIRESREGRGTFPLPLFGRNCRVMWRKSDIETWRGDDSEVLHYAPLLPMYQATPTKSNAQVRKELEKLGIKLS